MWCISDHVQGGHLSISISPWLRKSVNNKWLSWRYQSKWWFKGNWCYLRMWSIRGRQGWAVDSISGWRKWLKLWCQHLKKWSAEIDPVLDSANVSNKGEGGNKKVLDQFRMKEAWEIFNPHWLNLGGFLSKVGFLTLAKVIIQPFSFS